MDANEQMSTLRTTNMTPLGLDIDDLRLPVKEAVRTAAEMRFSALEVGAVHGEITPEQLGESGRRHFRRFVEGFGLGLAALSADVPQTRLTDPQTVDERVFRTCRIIDLARALGVNVVTAGASALTHPESGEPSPLALEALRQIGAAADARGVHYALRPSHESPEKLAGLLDVLHCPSIRIGLDPAALAMTGVNPLAIVERLGDRVSLFHVRDATAGLAERPGKETRIGEGHIDIPALMELLDAAAYGGPHILRRMDTATPIADLAAGREYIERELRQRK